MLKDRLKYSNYSPLEVDVLANESLWVQVDTKYNL